MVALMSASDPLLCSLPTVQGWLNDCNGADTMNSAAIDE